MKSSIGRYIQDSNFNIENYSIHPEAEDAYRHHLNLKPEYNSDLLSPAFLENHQYIHPLMVIKKPKSSSKSSQYWFISGWAILSQLSRQGATTLKFIEVGEKVDVDVSSLAWTYVASLETNGFDREKNFKDLKEIFEKLSLDRGVKSLTLGGSSKKVCVSHLKVYSGQSRGVIRRQFNSEPESKSPISDYFKSKRSET